MHPSEDPSGSFPEQQYFVEDLACRFEELAKSFRALTPILLMMLLQGCMYSPNYSDELPEACHSLSDQDIEERRKRIYDLLDEHTAPEEARAFLQSGVNPCQERRIVDNTEDLIEEVSDAGFERCLDIFERARNRCGIMNPDRYDLDDLEAFVKNYESPEHQAERDQVLVFSSRRDHQKTALGIQVLNVDSYKVGELLPFYKVILIETSSLSEIKAHLDSLESRGVLQEGKLKSVLLIGHGYQTTTQNGLKASNLHELSRLNRYWKREDQPSFFYFSCESAEGGSAERNMVNTTSLVFPGVQVTGCETVVEDVDYELDDRGRLVPGSLELSTYFGFDRSFTANRDNAVRNEAWRLWKKMSENGICEQDVAFFQSLVNHGIYSPSDVRTVCLYEYQPEQYAQLKAAGWEVHDFVHHNKKLLPLASALAYAGAGVRGRQKMLRLQNAGIAADIYAQLRNSLRVSHSDESVLTASNLIGFQRDGYHLLELNRYFLMGQTDFELIRADRELARLTNQQTLTQTVRIAGR